jgi:hypothetical protein
MELMTGFESVTSSLSRTRTKVKFEYEISAVALGGVYGYT